MSDTSAVSETKLSISTVFDRDFFKLTAPLILQSVLNSMVSAVDCIMLGRLNQQALSAVTLAGQLTQIFLLLLNALSVGNTMLMTQYFSKNDRESVRKVMIITLRFSACLGFLIFIIAFFLPEATMKLFTNDDQLIPLGVSYLRTVSFSFLFMSISQIYLNSMKNVGNAIASTIFGSIAILLNIFLNTLLIYGKLGFPALGIRGAAIATDIARGVELLLTLIFILASGRLRIGPVKDIFVSHRGLLKKYMRYTMPSVVQVGEYTIAIALLMAILGHIDSDVIAASSVASILFTLAASFVTGSYATAIGIKLGYLLGKGEVALAKRTADFYLWGAAAAGTVVGMVLALTGSYAIPIFGTLTDTAYQYARVMIVLMGIKCVGKFINHSLATGIFTSGGDIMYLLKLDFINLWLIILPLSAIAAFVLKLPPLVVYAIINLDEYTKIVLMIKRYKKYAWAKNLTYKDWAPPGKYERQIREKIVEEMPLGIMLISNTGHIVLTNNACAELLCMDREQLEGRNYRLLFLENNASGDEISDLLLETIYDKGKAQDCEVTWQMNGHSRPLHIHAMFMEDEDCKMGLCLMIEERRNLIQGSL